VDDLEGDRRQAAPVADFWGGAAGAGIRYPAMRVTSPPPFAVLVVAFALSACGGGSGTPPATPEVKVAPAPLAKATEPPPQPDVAGDDAPSEDDAAVPISKADPTLGPRGAPLTLVFFGDFQCPFSGKVATTVDTLTAKYAGDLRVVWKNEPLPFHPNARPAAEAAEAVRMLGGDKAFWRFFREAFRNQAQLSPASYETWAEDAGVDRASFRRLVDAHAGAAKFDADHAVAQRVGVQGTPAFFVNGVHLSGAQPIEKFEAIFEVEKPKAIARIAEGTPQDGVYAAMARENFKMPSQTDATDDAKDEVVWSVPVGTSPVRGSKTALVTLVEFGDFQCPFTKRVQPTLDQLRATYGDKLRIVWKDEALPFHPRAHPAAELAREARAQKGDAGFWAAHDALFASQPNLDDAALDGVAQRAGLDLGKVHAAIKGQRYKSSMAADEDLAEDVQASGTPHFFVNGRRLAGLQPLEKLTALIDAELAKAQAKVAAGTAPGAIYDAIVKAGKTADPPPTKLVALSPSAPVRGNPTGSVLIQELGDFQCPFTQRVQATLDEVLRTFPQVKLVFRNLPLPMHNDAPLAAEAALEAQRQKGNAGFFKMHDKLFAGQKTPGGLERPALEGYASELGLAMGAFRDALDQHTHKARVDADAKAASDAGISGTPSFVVGGYFLSGAQPITKFRKLIERVLKDGPAKPAPFVAASPSPPPPAGTLGIVDVKVGQGRAVAAGDTLSVHYVGTLTDGTEFDSSRKRGQPFQFTIGKGMVIKGWDQGLVGMRAGGVRKLTIPASLAYGDRGAGKIPAQSTLLFDVELLSIR
jgi:protein-disulfide isomerase